MPNYNHRDAVADGLGGQALTSAATRSAILDRAFAHRVECGYWGATTVAIAQNTGLSRGAIRHTFPSKPDIIRGAVKHRRNERLGAFPRAMMRRPAAGQDRVVLYGDAFLEHHGWHPLFVPFIEPSLVARSDPELVGILKAARARPTGLPGSSREGHKARYDRSELRFDWSWRAIRRKPIRGLADRVGIKRAAIAPGAQQRGRGCRRGRSDTHGFDATWDRARSS